MVQNKTHTPLNYQSFLLWLEAYKKAWETRDPKAAGKLFTEDATYRETPFDNLMRGRTAIIEYWSDVPKSQENIHFRYEILAVTEKRGCARWWASFVRIPSKIKVIYDGIFVVEMNQSDECTKFEEWWHRQETAP